MRMGKPMRMFFIVVYYHHITSRTRTRAQPLFNLKINNHEHITQAHPPNVYYAISISMRNVNKLHHAQAVHRSNKQTSNV
jgi:hypothetical protein